MSEVKERCSCVGRHVHAAGLFDYTVSSHTTSASFSQAGRATTHHGDLMDGAGVQSHRLAVAGVWHAVGETLRSREGLVRSLRGIYILCLANGHLGGREGPELSHRKDNDARGE